ncbi:hypothetical protein SVIOM342S_03028 [Streptomyces violaceorubidus]
MPTRVNVSVTRANTRPVGADRVGSGPCTTQIMSLAHRPTPECPAIAPKEGHDPTRGLTTEDPPAPEPGSLYEGAPHPWRAGRKPAAG